MKNNKGIILSTYIYVLLVFFILLLTTMLLVLNNTKLLATKIKENASDITKSEADDFNILLIGSKNVYAVQGTAYVDDGYIAESKTGKTIIAKVESTVNINTIGDYTYKYTIIYGGISKSVTRNVKVISSTQNYDYTGNVQTFIAPISGYYKLETWGAQGGQATGGTNGGTISTITPGYGGYSNGVTYLEKNQKIFIYVGGAGQANCAPPSWSIVANCSGGYNGGGSTASADAYVYISGGGGATHISTVTGLLSTLSSEQSKILIVAGGGGGGTYYNWNSSGYKGYGGSGGGFSGVAGTGSTSSYTSTPGNQSSGFAFGAGGSSYAGSGGGGGYYGGHTSWSFPTAAAGGAGYIANPSLISYGSTLKSMSCYNCPSSSNPSTLTYSVTNVSATATSSYAKSGNGYAKIAFMGTTLPTKNNTKLNNTRYIKDCMNGNTTTANNHIVEIQAIYNGTNVAIGKSVTGTVAENSSKPYSRITDGDLYVENHAQTSLTGFQCLTVDLGQVYDLDSVTVWHYYQDGRTYYSNTTYVSSNNSAWTPIIANTNPETPFGKTFTDWDANTTVVPLYRVSNLITNGSFENGLTGWGISGDTAKASVVSTTSIYGTYSYKTTGTSKIQENIIWLNDTSFYQTGHIYYYSQYVKNTSSVLAVTHLNCGGNNLELVQTTNASFAETSGEITCGSTTDKYLAAAWVPSAGNGYAIYLDGLLLIDLTATFGTGKEPTKAWCDANLNYFDGTQNLNLNP